MMEKQTIVVKVGTSSLTLSDGTMDAEKIRNITTQLAALQTACLLYTSDAADEL